MINPSQSGCRQFSKHVTGFYYEQIRDRPIENIDERQERMYWNNGLWSVVFSKGSKITVNQLRFVTLER